MQTITCGNCPNFSLQDFDKNGNYDRCDTVENLRLRGCIQMEIETAPGYDEIIEVSIKHGSFLT